MTKKSFDEVLPLDPFGGMKPEPDLLNAVIKKSAPSNKKPKAKTAKVTVGLWFNEEAGDIRLDIPGHGLSTVNADASSKRGNPHLFNKLAKLLRDQGKPHPEIVEEWDYGRG